MALTIRFIACVSHFAFRITANSLIEGWVVGAMPVGVVCVGFGRLSPRASGLRLGTCVKDVTRAFDSEPECRTRGQIVPLASADRVFRSGRRPSARLQSSCPCLTVPPRAGRVLAYPVERPAR